MTEKQKIMLSTAIRMFTIMTTFAILLDPAETTRWIRTNIEHFVKVVAKLNRTCVVKASFCPKISFGIGTSQTCLFHPRCSSAYKLIAAKADNGIFDMLVVFHAK